MATVDPAAQRRRTVRRRAVPDRQSERAQPARCSNTCKGPDFPTGGVDRRSAARRSPRPTRPAAARSACARAGTRRTPAAAPTSIVITEIPWLVQKSRLVEKLAELLNEKKLPLVADVRDESAEDIRLVIEPRVAHGRCRAADGIAVQAHRAREPHSAQHERAGEGPHPEGARPRRSLARMARPPPRRAAAPLEASPGGDRAPPGSARRLSDRLSQPRQGHQDHPHARTSPSPS